MKKITNPLQKDLPYASKRTFSRRISRLSLFALPLAILPFLVLWLSLILGSLGPAFQQIANVTQNLFAPSLLLWIASGVVGILAILRIERSEGKLYGISLAACGLVIPVLAIVFVVVMQVIRFLS